MDTVREHINFTNQAIVDEESRCVKVMLVKYKCAIILALVIVAAFQLTYITVKELNTNGVIDKLAKVLLEQTLQENRTMALLNQNGDMFSSETIQKFPDKSPEYE